MRGHDIYLSAEEAGPEIRNQRPSVLSSVFGWREGKNDRFSFRKTVQMSVRVFTFVPRRRNRLSPLILLLEGSLPFLTSRQSKRNFDELDQQPKFL